MSNILHWFCYLKKKKVFHHKSRSITTTLFWCWGNASAATTITYMQAISFFALTFCLFCFCFWEVPNHGLVWLITKNTKANSIEKSSMDIEIKSTIVKPQFYCRFKLEWIGWRATWYIWINDCVIWSLAARGVMRTE